MSDPLRFPRTSERGGLFLCAGREAPYNTQSSLDAPASQPARGGWLHYPTMSHRGLHDGLALTTRVCDHNTPLRRPPPPRTCV
jgi:hypothetical protein